MRVQTASVYGLALLTFALHLGFSERQGFFSDETYFVDCSQHLAFGYFDITPLVPVLIRIARLLFGDTLFAVRFFPAVGHAGTVLLTGLIARELKGGLFAQCLAALSVLIAPAYLMLGGLFITPTLEPFLWSLTSYFILLVMVRDQKRLWPAAGLSAGLGFMNKPSMLLHAFSLLLALLGSSARKILLNRWTGGAVLLGVLVTLPNWIWQFRNEWNTVVFLQSLRESASFKDVGAGSLLLAPILALHPINAILWTGGLASLILTRELRPYRFFAAAFGISTATLLLVGGKPYYLSGVYPFLLAAGAFSLERRIDFARRPQRIFKPLVMIAFVAAGVALAPAGLPLLPTERTLSYLDSLRLKPLADALQLKGVREDRDGKERDSFLRRLSAVHQRVLSQGAGPVAILTSHYFQASWVNVLGSSFGLPKAASGNNAYFHWGPGETPVAVTLAVGFQKDFLLRFFGEVEQASESSEVHLCRNPRRPLQEVWSEFRSFPF